MRVSVRIAKFFMKFYPPKIADDDFFRSYESASDAEKKEMRLQSARYRYEYEKKEINYFKKYFPEFNADKLAGKSVLDLGCFTGGQLVYWSEQYHLNPVGIDVHELMILGGKEFSEERNVSVRFDVGFGENLPYPSSSFDLITTYDVLEHVQDVSKVIEECHRVLKPGGLMMAVFPPYFQPLEHHLTLVTRMPALQWFFSGDVLNEASHLLGLELGCPYKLNPELEEWERLRSLNGITIKKFKK